MLDVQHLEVSYGATQVLRDVSFHVPERSIVALLGGNGSGKTTTLNVLSGLLAPQGGTVTLDGGRIDGLATHDVVARGLVQVPQGREVWGGMTVHDNLMLGAALRRDRRTIDADVAEMLALFPVLEQKRRARAATLSGGEQQMLAIARALMARPRVLLLDEPSLGLAPMLAREIFRVIRRISAEGVAVLLVEQNARRALALASRGYVLETGRLVASVTSAELSADPRVRTAYLGLDRIRADAG